MTIDAAWTTASRAWLEFLDDRTPNDRGLHCRELRDLSFDELSAYPEAFDWMFPSDRFSLAASAAPQLIAAEAALLLAAPGARQAVKLNYTHVIHVCGMLVDHDGSVDGDDRRGVLKWAARASPMDQRFARVLSCLKLSGMRGPASGSPPAAEDGPEFAEEFASGVARLVCARRPHATLPAEWVQAGGPLPEPSVFGQRWRAALPAEGAPSGGFGETVGRLITRLIPAQ